MKLIALQLGALLADSQGSTALRAIEFDWPQQPWQWGLYGGCIALAVLLAVFVYFRDTAELSGFWRFWLTALRVAVIAALVLIALNPQERTQKMAHRPSRAALLVDTSLSMRYPQEPVAAESAPAEEAASASRAKAVEDLLARSPLIDRLREQHELSIYTFDSVLAGPHRVYYPNSGTPDANASGNSESSALGTAIDENPLDWEELLRPRGVETRLGESLVDLLRQVSGRTLSGLVVISDGASNAGIEPETANEVAKATKTRLFSVGVGSTQPPVNLRIVNLQGPTDVHVGDDYEITAFVQGRGLAGREVEVELLMRPEGEEGKPFAAEPKPRSVTLFEDGIPVEVTFRQTPSVAGGVEFFVRARPAGGVRELTTDDNERRKSVNIIDRKTRVLLIAGGPMRDYRFVRNMLYRHGAVSTDVWLQTVEPSTAAAVSQESDNLLLDFPSTASELFEYDVIVAFDPDWTRIPAERLELLADWVSRHAGGLILVAGDVYTPELAGATEDLKAVLDLYPVFLSPLLLEFQFEKTADQPWPIELTREGEEAGFLQLTDTPATSTDAWKSFSGVYRCYPTAGAKAGATVYLRFSDPRAETEYGPPILLASQFYGAGRTMYLGSSELWRLRGLDEQFYDRFWTKTIREIGQGRLRRGTSRGMVLLEREQYVLGQTVRVRVNLLDPQLEPFEAQTVAMEVFDPTGRPLVPARRLRRDENRPGQFAGDFRAGMPGTYRIEVPVPESSEQLVSKIEVVVPNLESDDPRQNARLLNDLVRDTGGEYLRLAEAEAKLPPLLPNRSEEFLVDERLRTLWDRQWVLYLLVGLLGVEWLTRKLLKLA